MKCKKCGIKFADDLNSCPKCATKAVKSGELQKKASGKLLIWACTGLLGVAVLIMAGYFIFNTPTKTASESQVRQALFVAGFKDGNIVVKNGNDFDWTNTRVTIVTGAMNHYSKDAGVIKKGEIIKYSLTGFVSSNGEVYDNEKYIPKQVLISGDNVSGGREY